MNISFDDQSARPAGNAPAQPCHRLYLSIPASYTYLKVLGASVESILDATYDGSDTSAQPPDQPEKDLLIYQARLAAHETCTNIIDHAYYGKPGTIQALMVIETQPDPASDQPRHATRLRIDFFDNGRSFDPQAVASPNLNEAQTGGYGLFLIHSLMDQVLYESQHGHNHWQLIKSLPEKISGTTSK